MFAPCLRVANNGSAVTKHARSWPTPGVPIKPKLTPQATNNYQFNDFRNEKDTAMKDLKPFPIILSVSAFLCVAFAIATNTATVASISAFEVEAGESEKPRRERGRSSKKYKEKARIGEEILLVGSDGY